MKEIMECKVIKYLNEAVKIKLSNGMKGILSSAEISDLSIPIEEKVYIGQVLTVLVEYTANGLKISHKYLLESQDTFFENHLGDMVKARVIYSTRIGCLLELSSNVHYFVKDMCNLKKGTFVWASITMYGKVIIDSVLYDEERNYYPSYKYIIPNIIEDIVDGNKFAA